jgi:hypothetical protein
VTVVEMTASVFYKPGSGERICSTPAGGELPAGAVVVGMLDGTGWHPAEPGGDVPFAVAAAMRRRDELAGEQVSRWELVDRAAQDGRVVVVCVDDTLDAVAELAHRHPDVAVRLGGHGQLAGITVCSPGSATWERATAAADVHPGPGYQWVAYGPTAVERRRVAVVAAVLNELASGPVDHVDVGSVLAATTGMDPDDAWEAVIGVVGPGVAVWLAANPATPARVLAALASSSDAALRTAAGAHDRTAAATLARLAGDQEAGVRSAVAANHRAPQELLAELAVDRDDIVRWSVANNPSCDDGILAELAAAGGPVGSFADRQLGRRTRRP